MDQLEAIVSDIGNERVGPDGGLTGRRSIFETHYKTALVMGSFFVTTLGWFAWIAFLDAIYPAGTFGPYAIRHSFRNAWGKDATWWATVFAVLAFLGLLELCGKVVRQWLLVAGLWQWRPWKRRSLGDNMEEWDVELWQEMEQDPAMRERFRVLARSGEGAVDEACADDDADDDAADDDAAMRADV